LQQRERPFHPFLGGGLCSRKERMPAFTFCKTKGGIFSFKIPLKTKQITKGLDLALDVQWFFRAQKENENYTEFSVL
jgi:hypothetical protein